MVLAAVWLAGRLAMAFGSGVWVAIVDLAFLPVAAGVLLQVLIKAKSKRNYFVGALPAMLALANLFFHLAVLRCDRGRSTDGDAPCPGPGGAARDHRRRPRHPDVHLQRACAASSSGAT